MTPTQSLVSRTRRDWLATAHALRERHPELAAKITLARLTEGAAHPDELLTIAFTRAEYDRLLDRVPVMSWRRTPDKLDPALTGDEPDQTIADVEAFLGFQSERSNA